MNKQKRSDFIVKNAKIYKNLIKSAGAFKRRKLSEFCHAGKQHITTWCKSKLESVLKVGENIKRLQWATCTTIKRTVKMIRTSDMTIGSTYGKYRNRRTACLEGHCAMPRLKARKPTHEACIYFEQKGDKQ